MATYKVIQDIEAEDKLVGPLSLRQFIYGGIAALCGYLAFLAVSKNVSFFLVVLVPVMLFTGFFAFPWGRDQPTEVWALAKIRFLMKPRRRIWDQSGVKDLVTVTAPKRIEKVYTNGLSQVEVQSRLNALANTLDSRGWAVKNVNTNLYDQTQATELPDSDRLVQPSNMPQDVTPVDVLPSDDMLDEVNNPRAQQLDQMMTTASNNHRQEIIKELNQQDDIAQPVTEANLPPPADYWFLNKPLDMPSIHDGNAVFSDSHVVIPGSEEDQAGIPAAEPTPDEKAFAEKLKAQKEKGLQAVNYQHLKVIQPLGAQKVQNRGKSNQVDQNIPDIQATPVTPAPDPAKMSLANNNDLNISTIARIANNQDEQPDEIVISLHDHSS